MVPAKNYVDLLARPAGFEPNVGQEHATVRPDIEVIEEGRVHTTLEAMSRKFKTGDGS